jgi:hypothetical protein
MAKCLYPLKGMILIADQEYIGRQWFNDLIEKIELNFVIRILETDYRLYLTMEGKVICSITQKN